ncbi:MAG: helix-turn-helix transcriptional regulator [Pseudomonadota bacterium]
MRETDFAGTRIRQRRTTLGLKQSELARAVGISASYLNLIEHNRRRIGGKTLLQIAEALEVEASLLSEGAEASLLASLKEAVEEIPVGVTRSAATPELDRIEEFAGRFPGWAQLIISLQEQKGQLQRSVNAMTERLSNDPLLSDALHEVISTVTSIRSTASILVETKELEPEWLMRFHRNMNEDGERLAQGAEALVHYLEQGPNSNASMISTGDEVEAFLAENQYHFPELERQADRLVASDVSIEKLIAESDAIASEASVDLAHETLERYLQDARALPLDQVSELIATHGIHPEVIMRAFDVPMAQVLRRIANLPEEATGATGLYAMRTSGEMLPRKPLRGLTLPRSFSGCAYWPLNSTLTDPTRPVLTSMRQNDFRFVAMSAAEQDVSAGFSTSGACTAYMLIIPELNNPEGLALPVETDRCSVCGLTDCVAPH